MLPKAYRVRKNSEFTKIYQDSRSFAARNIVLFVRKREDSEQMSFQSHFWLFH